MRWLSEEEACLQIVTTLRRTPSSRAAFVLIAGAGQSYPLIPTVGEMVTRDIAWWLYARRHGKGQPRFGPRPPGDSGLANFERELWASLEEQFRSEPTMAFALRDGVPSRDGLNNTARAYQCVMSEQSRHGLFRPAERREYLRDVNRRCGAGVSVANLYLGSLLSAQQQLLLLAYLFRTVITTNFDDMIERSLQMHHVDHFVSDRPDRFGNLDDPYFDKLHIVHAHGSVNRHMLANTDGEVAGLRAKNAAVLANYLQRQGVIVIGYGGWDDALMDALASVDAFDGNLYWLDIFDAVSAPRMLSPHARQLLETGHNSAYYVPIAGAEQFFQRLHQLCGLGNMPEIIENPVAPVRRLLLSIANSHGDQSGSAAPLLVSEAVKERARTLMSMEQWLSEHPTSGLDLGAPKSAAQPVSAVDAALARAGELLGRRATDEAEAVLIEALKGESLTAVERFRLEMAHAGVHYQAGDNKRAVELVSKVIAGEHPERERCGLYVHRGFIQLQLGSAAAALEDYNSAIACQEIAPALDLAQAFCERAHLYQISGRTTEAVADYKTVLELKGADRSQRSRAAMGLWAMTPDLDVDAKRAAETLLRKHVRDDPMTRAFLEIQTALRSLRERDVVQARHVLDAVVADIEFPVQMKGVAQEMLRAIDAGEAPEVVAKLFERHA